MIVTLSFGGLELGLFPVHNISSGGMALLGTIANVGVNRLVTVHIPANANSGSERMEVKALVVYQAANLTGLMWVETIPLQDAGACFSESATMTHGPG